MCVIAESDDGTIEHKDHHAVNSEPTKGPFNLWTEAIKGEKHVVAKANLRMKPTKIKE